MKSKLALSFLILSVCLSGLGNAQLVNVVSQSQLSDGTKYQFPLSDAEVKASPEWKAADPTPALDPRKASQLAEDFLNKLTQDKKIKWGLSSITLHKISLAPERWIYKVKFDQVIYLSGNESYIGPIQTFEVIVYLSGKIVDPVVSNTKSK